MKRPKRLCMAIVAAIAMALSALPVQAQNRVDEFGIFDHMSLGLTLGTTGVGLDLAAPVTDYLQVRAGYNFFSGFKYKEDVNYRSLANPTNGKIEIEGTNYMGTGHLLLDVYPFRDYTFHATAGFYIGTDEVVEIENTTPVRGIERGAGVVIGDYLIHFDANGIAHGNIKVNKFRPYVGIGFGRSVPRKRFGVSGDFGVQFWGKPKVYEKQAGGDVELKKENLGDEGSKYYEVISKISVWPVLNLRLTYRIF